MPPNDFAAQRNPRLLSWLLLFTRGFLKTDGPFIRAIDQALASRNVQRQAYYIGTLVGNHVHCCVKVSICCVFRET